MNTAANTAGTAVSGNASDQRANIPGRWIDRVRIGSIRDGDSESFLLERHRDAGRLANAIALLRARQIDRGGGAAATSAATVSSSVR
jgi:hypothetical protein